jgi:hypothetical protein
MSLVEISGDCRVWRWLERRARERRAKDYLRLYPHDEPAVRSILGIPASGLGIPASGCPESAREAAEIANGRKLSEAEWASYARRWERVWDAIVLPKRKPHR